ncbi:hypothetical protein [Thiohalobacter sp.]|uniref:hypothetical protein n=1 Tax=Thiohalobacter sp. TaxID=2025948 RepID=UPI00260489B2|nr:hypothetical protein [Thiohalobacter sp.]
MRNRHITIEGGQDAPDATSGIAPSAATGADRVRELEHLLETARKVRDQADAELTSTRFMNEAARKRIEAARRMEQKVEAELRRLRLETARREGRNVWAPGDPLPTETPASDTDFEVALLTGSPRPRLRRDPSESDLRLAEDAPRPAPPPQAAAPQGRSRSSTRHDRQRPAAAAPARRRGSTLRSLAIAVIVALGIGVGAAATLVLLQPQLVDRALAGIPLNHLLPGGKATPATPAAPKATTPPSPGNAGQDKATNKAPSASWRSRVAAEEMRLRRAAEQRYQARLRSRRAAPPPAAPATMPEPDVAVVPSAALF